MHKYRRQYQLSDYRKENIYDKPSKLEVVIEIVCFKFFNLDATNKTPGAAGATR